MNSKRLSTEIKEYCFALGVDLVGFTAAKEDRENKDHLKKFIDEGRNADMHYLEDYSLRVNPEKLLANAKSIIVIGLNYYNEAPKTGPQEGKIARYAYGRDYHKVMRGILKKIEKFIKEKDPKAQCKICVDSAPLLEKDYAVKAGLGFIGKNTTLINPRFGSFILLGELLTTLELDHDKEKKGTCGTCTRCLDSCPTKALIAAGLMDARNCISYLTVENKKAIPKRFHKAIGNRIFGCDTCQEVCPYNKAHTKINKNPDFCRFIAGPSIPLKKILEIKTDHEYLKSYAGSPLMRAKRKGLQRNARIALRNI